MRLFEWLFFAFAPILAAAAPPAPCGLHIQTPSDRVFAKVSGARAWQEYKSIDKVPDLGTDGGISAELWRGSDGTLSVRTIEPGEDFWTYTGYCFSKNGQLDRIAFEIRTAWGWGYQLKASIETGALHAPLSGFFDTRTEKSIQRPAGAEDIAEALKPRLYLREEQLPFSKLMVKRPTSGPQTGSNSQE